MSRPAVFFDRDNTLIANGDYLGDPDGVVLIDGAADAVARVRALGFATIVVSNQSGVARGMFDEDAVRAVNARMDQALIEVHPDAVIEHHEFCPHHPEGTVADYKGDSARRKPQPGMILDAAESLDLDLRRSWLIGDAPRDVEAGQRAGCRTILVRDTSLPNASPEASKRLNVAPDYVASSLSDAVDFIEMQLETLGDDGLTDPPLAASQDAVEEIEPRVAESSPLETVAADAPLPDAPGYEPRYETARPDEPSKTTVDDEDDEIPEGIEVPIPSVTNTLGAMSEAIVAAAPPSSTDKQTVMLLERVVEELRRANDPPQDFSVAKMFAGIVQGFALAAMFGALLFRDAPAGSTTFQTLMLVAIFLQAMVSSLVLMGR